ncbi:hypothetical protein IT570_07715 [Candidatus Sumerlaeota bacterium]|nr:hypothetical protein [Candidatus Sumerlaeota bacterium]
MSEMKPREKAMLGIVIAAFVFFIAWRMGLDEALSKFVSGGDSDISSLEEKFQKNVEKLGKMYEIEREFKRVGELPAGSDEEKVRPALAFTQQVSDMCRELGFDFPPIRPQAMPIDGVDDYELINVTIKTEGTFANTISLFKKFQDRGLIFRVVNLRSVRDKDQIVANVTVARIAPVQKRESSRGRGPSRS